MLLQLSLTSCALLAPGMRPLEGTTSSARSPASRMIQLPAGPADGLKAWFTSTALDVASLYGSVALANAAIKAGASLESRAMSAFYDSSRRVGASTPLQFATVAGQARVVKALIEAGASLEALGGKSYTPLQYAVMGGSIDMVRVLIEGGASLEAVGEAGYRPLQLAVVQGNIDIITALADAGASLKVVCNRGLTPLQWATGFPERVDSIGPLGRFPGGAPTSDVIRALTEAGASLTALGGPGGGLMTPLQVGFSSARRPSRPTAC